ncbi:prephenate dehydrogenase [Mesorhizobium sp. L-8-3]|uniref:prephenate dehydrogenase n=1 Tax=Mesorhizobium sp. L-8-3 TaxID=2744522 RepID=UPI0019263DB0|nr:prephenate dehydrogenase [Mesorhizobium sp. L-8-3]BCH22491.1 hypothetical protein MesoLjLb_22760 [Mesorhizobium sp. L-8-3]
MFRESNARPTLGIVGFGAFGRLMARHLRPYFRLCAYDPSPPAPDVAGFEDITFADLETVARSPVVVLAMPVDRIRETVAAMAPHMQPGALVLDVGSVKSMPAGIMKQGLPDNVDVVATHPLFGPQSAVDGIAGLKIAVCPIRGGQGRRVIAFLKRRLRLDVIVTTPEAHDREVAAAQGLTHLIAKVLVRMEPLPTAMTTRSFDLIMEAVGMVRHDTAEVFHAIERANPHAHDVRRRFFDLASALDAELAGET